MEKFEAVEEKRWDSSCEVQQELNLQPSVFDTDDLPLVNACERFGMTASSSGGWDSNPRALAYEANEVTGLLNPA